MPSFKSLFILGLTALSAFALPATGSDNALVARSDAVAARAIVPVVAEEIAVMKRAPEPELLPRGKSVPDILNTCNDALNGIKSHLLDITVNASVKVDVKIIVDIILQIKVILSTCLTDLKAVIGVGLNILLGLQITLVLNVCVSIITVVTACLKISINACVDVDLHLVLDAIVDIDVVLTAVLQILAGALLGLVGLLLGLLNAVVGLVADLKLVGLVKVCLFLGISL